MPKSLFTRAPKRCAQCGAPQFQLITRFGRVGYVYTLHCSKGCPPKDRAAVARRAA
jgi:hypothetical protein